MTTQVPSSMINQDGGLTAAALAANAVTTVKIADANVTTAKLAASAVTPAKLAQPLTLGIPQLSTSGTSIDFTGIPSWVNRVTVTLNGVSKNSTGSTLIQLGTSSGVETTGYTSAGTNFTGGVTSTSGFIAADGAAAWIIYGTLTLVHQGYNSWVATFLGSLGAVSATFLMSAGAKTLGAVLDRVRITSSTGTDTFDAGAINILYE